MFKQYYSVYDKVSKIYQQPFLQHNDAMAVRSIGDAVRKDEIFSTHAKDFALYLVGAFNEETGELTPVEPRKVIELEQTTEE